MKVLIGYFGSKGSGQDFAQILTSAGELSGDQMFLADSKANFKFIKFLPFQFFLARKSLLKRVDDLGVDLVVFPMSNPIDVGLGKQLKKRGVTCIRLVHDYRRHPGDFYPFNWIIRKILKDADGIVCLSNFVAKEVSSRHKNVNLIVAQHPFYFPLSNKRTELRPSTERKLLFIGRRARYKGLDQLISTWERIGGEFNTLTVAGKHKQLSDKPRLMQVSGWLSDAEFHHLVNSHDIIVLPYSEASQSGIIPLAIQYRKPVVIFPVGGLPEQIKHYQNGIIADSLDTNDLVKAIDKALEFNWNLEEVDVAQSHKQFYNTIIEFKTLLDTQ